MKLAGNYYLELVDLLNENKIDLDYIKFPALGFQYHLHYDVGLVEYEAWVTRLNKVRPVMIHGVGPTCSDIGKKTFRQELDVAIAKKVISLSGMNGISLHFAGVDTSLSNQENRRILIDNINYLKEVFYDVEFLEFENVDANPFRRKDTFGICIDPEFITDVINETGVKLLLDISHAYCTARCLEMDFYDYMNRLPLDRLHEIHINGWIDSGTDIMAHLKITEEGYEALSHVLEIKKPEIITIEYGRNSDRMNLGIPLMSPEGKNESAKLEILEQVNRVKEIMKMY